MLGQLVMKILLFILIIFSISYIPFKGLAQTTGLIVDPASVSGAAVLDPNGDGYISADNSGFSVDDNAESELPYRPLTVPAIEPTSDIATGPDCGFTDFSDDGTGYPAASYVDASNNWLFRFRLGGFATNSKGYSILIDTDNKFGNLGADADPNYVSGNPGFEIEIELVTNFGVRLNDIDGAITPSLQTELSDTDYSQKAIAQSLACSDFDYFYDFYIPFSTITSFFPSITASTPMRFVANTVSSTQSGIEGNVSDVGGIDDEAYGGNIERMWEVIIDAQVPVAPEDINSGFPPIRSDAPVVTDPINSGVTSVSGTSGEADGTTIEVFKNGGSVGTTTVTAGIWTLSGLTALVENDVITATATASGESVSLSSDQVIVGANCSTAPTITCSSRKAVEITNAATLPVGTVIRVYNPDDISYPGTINSLTVTTAATDFVVVCDAGGSSCTSGPNCQPAGSYWVTVQVSGECESIPSAPVCAGGGVSPSATPAITTSPIEPTTTAVSGTSSSGFEIFLYIDGALTNTTTADGSGNWSFGSLNLELGQSVDIRALETGECMSAAASSTVTEQTTTPNIQGSIANGATTVSGTSTEEAGTVIGVFVDAASAGTVTVDGNGNWVITGLSLSTGEVINATALATGKSVSDLSLSITVQGNSLAPAITGSYVEGETSVSGTSPSANGTVITVYIDGVSLGSTTVSTGTWTLTGLSATNFDLYAGGALTATAAETGMAESSESTSVTVGCSTPALNKSVNVLTTEICESTTAQVQIVSSESAVIYTLKDNGNTTARSSSLVGTGGNITFDSFSLTSTETLQIEAQKISDLSCSGLNSNTAPITVHPNPLDDRSVSSTETSIDTGNSTTVEVASSELGVSYQLRNDADDSAVGSPVAGTGGNILLPTGNLTNPTTFNVLATDSDPITCSVEQVQTATVTINPLPVSLISFEAEVNESENIVELKWTTASEVNNNFFTLERSWDARKFDEIARIDGNGNSNEPKSYTVADKNPFPGKSYYRLKQTDFDGVFEYFKVVSADLPVKYSSIVVFPNPFSSFTSIRINNPALPNTKIQVSLLDTFGKEIRRVAGRVEVIIQRKGLPQGIYFYKVYAGSQILKVGRLMLRDN